ncbi:hypothetical protein BX666DRAFT_962343 [Dichotomocladium elegans]|nr:hypothetical protein BX666DRAFT_962343 [Dichotomocladium elegans]
MTIASSSSHENPATARTNHIIIEQQPPSPPAPPSVYNSSNFIRQSTMDPLPSVVQISWSQSMLNAGHPNAAAFLSSPSASPQTGTTTAAAEHPNQSPASKNAEDSRSSATNTIGRTFSRHQTSYGQHEQERKHQNMLPFLPLSTSPMNTHGSAVSRGQSTVSGATAVHNYEDTFGVVSYPSTLPVSSPPAAPAPWEQSSLPPPARSIIRSSDSNPNNATSFYINHRHGSHESTGNDSHPSSAGASSSAVYTNFRSNGNSSRDQQTHTEIQTQQQQQQSNIPNAPWLPSSMWPCNTNNDNVSSFSPQQPHLLSEHQRSSQNDLTQDNFSLELLDTSIPNLMSSKKHTSSFSIHPTRSGPVIRVWWTIKR